MHIGAGCVEVKVEEGKNGLPREAADGGTEERKILRTCLLLILQQPFFGGKKMEG